jgi:hypothetical protein
MGIDHSIHGATERLACLDAAVEKPTPSRLLLDFPIRCGPIPRHVPPKNQFMGGCSSPDSSRIETVVEKYDKCCSPISSYGNGFRPTPWTPQFMSREVESVEFLLRQVMSAGNVVVWDGLWKAGRHFDEVVFPSP